MLKPRTSKHGEVLFSINGTPVVPDGSPVVGKQVENVID